MFPTGGQEISPKIHQHFIPGLVGQHAKKDNSAMKRFILIFLILNGLKVSGQNYNLSDFIETQHPENNTSEWSKLNYSLLDFKVGYNNGNIEIVKASFSVNELIIPNGKLIANDNGEWGGSLIFKPNSIFKKSIEIKKGNIKYVFRFNNEIYFLEGLTHLSISEGGLYKIESNGHNLIYKKLLEFEDAPEAYGILNDTLLIASHKSFYFVHDLRKELIFKDTFWKSLYPNSILVRDIRNIYLGIRSGYVKIDLKEKEIKYYKFKE
jgi:hypothetical protein